MPRKTDNIGPISAQAQQDLVSEGIENFELPKSIVTKIAKSAIPDNAKLQKETVLSLVKGSTVFINYLAATAHDVAVSKQHKSISASDVLRALEMIEFGDLVDKLQDELLVYREHTRTDKTKKVSAGPSTAGSVKIRPITVPSAPRTMVPNGDALPQAQGAYMVVPAGGSISAGPEGVPMDVDEEMLDEGGADETEGEVEGEVEGVEEVDEDDGVTEDEMPDPMAVEVEELRVDTMGLEVHSAAAEPAE